MKARSLISCILLSVFIILLLSIGTQATEYKKVNTEVNASNIIEHIENGEDVNLTNCRIVGELNVNKINLEIVPDPNFDKLLKEGYTREEISNYYGLKENLSVIKSNIIITNSIFEKDLDFSNVLFNNSVDFTGATFNNSVDFTGATFNNSADFHMAKFNNFADFSEVTFNDSANFRMAKFNNPTYFTGATFNNSTYFLMAKFNNSADFSEVTFNNFADFRNVVFNNFADFFGATFNNSAYFTGATFNGSTGFEQVTFNKSADFGGATFNGSTDFQVPETSENIFTDGKMCAFFMKSYNDDSRYTDANNIYYNFRKKSQDKKALTDPSKLIDFFSWVTCGYGTRISHTLKLSVGIIFFFACLYRQSTTVTVINSKNKRKPVKVYWKEPKIYRLSDETEKKSLISFFDALYFSIMTFTTLGSEWNPRDNYRKWVAFEGILGYIMLGIFLATLSNVLRISSI